MGKGLSKQQTVILGLLQGTERGCVYQNCDSLGTNELVEELIAHELLSDQAPHRQVLSTVRRACSSLQRRGLIMGVYVRDANYAGAYTIEWSAAKQGPELPQDATK